MLLPAPCQVKTLRPRSQRCTSLASLPRFKLCLKICAGGVHDQLWQKMPVEETGEISFVHFSESGRLKAILRIWGIIPKADALTGGPRDLSRLGCTNRREQPPGSLVEQRGRTAVRRLAERSSRGALAPAR